MKGKRAVAILGSETLKHANKSVVYIKCSNVRDLLKSHATGTCLRPVYLKVRLRIVSKIIKDGLSCRDPTFTLASYIELCAAQS
jgi:hypothetical protein